jgi:folate-dependent phosphoribosylglycinamide formyltransferase PurN
MNICIFSTFDNFFLKKLILKLIRKNNNHNFFFYFVGDYNNLNNIFVKACSLGFINSLYFFFKSLILDLFKKNLLSSLDKNLILKKNAREIDVNEFLTKNNIDLILSINYPKYITKKNLKICRYGGINHHLGKLPNYKGRYPVARAILNNDKKIFVTVHHIDDKIDNGKVILSTPVIITNCKKDFIKIYDLIFEKSEKVISKSLKHVIHLRKKNLTKTKKNNKDYFYCKKLSLKKLLKLYSLKFIFNLA